MHKKKSILYITHEYDVNGASKSLISIIKRLMDDYNIHVLVRKEGDVTNILRNLQCKVIVKPFYLDVEPIVPTKCLSKIEWPIRVARYITFRTKVNRKVVFEMAHYVKENEISLIHTNSSSTFIGAQIAEKTSVPHVWHFREFLSEDFNLYPLRGWECLYKYASKSNMIICVSNSVLKKYEKYINTDIRCIYNGIEDSGEMLSRVSHKEFNLLQAGVLSQGKGTDVAVKAIRILHEKGYGNVHLYLAGRGNLDFCKDDYVKVSDYVHILGYIKDMRKLRENKQIDAELVCSKAEAFGRGTVEAMEFGNVVIGSNTAGTRELIKDGINGFLYKQGDSFDLACKIEKLLQNPYLLSELGKNGRKEFTDNFTMDKCIDKIKKVYDELLIK